MRYFHIIENSFFWQKFTEMEIFLLAGDWNNLILEVSYIQPKTQMFILSIY